MDSATFRPWRTRDPAPCPAGGLQTVVITDFPALSMDPNKKISLSRILEFRVTVRSGSRCACNKAAIRATARQVLTLKDGILVDTAFFTPNPEEKSPAP